MSPNSAVLLDITCTVLGIVRCAAVVLVLTEVRISQGEPPGKHGKGRVPQEQRGEETARIRSLSWRLSHGDRQVRGEGSCAAAGGKL